MSARSWSASGLALAAIAAPRMASACPTCAADGGSSGQLVMLAGMIGTPLAVAFLVGLGIRRALRDPDARAGETRRAEDR